MERLHKLTMPRPLIVKGKPLASVSDPVEAFRKGHPFQWGDAGRTGGGSLDIGRVEWIAREDVLDVGEHQFLVLLFMMQAKGHDGEQVKDMLIDVAAVSIGLLHARARDQPAFRPAVPLSQRVVIRVEEIGVLRMKGLVPWKRGQEEKGLPKPGHVGNMPFGRTHVWHGLNDIIFSGKRFAQVLSEAANALVLLCKIRFGSGLGAERTFLDGLCHDRFSF